LLLGASRCGGSARQVILRKGVGKNQPFRPPGRECAAATRTVTRIPSGLWYERTTCCAGAIAGSVRTQRRTFLREKPGKIPAPVRGLTCSLAHSPRARFSIVQGWDKI